MNGFNVQDVITCILKKNLSNTKSHLDKTPGKTVSEN